MLKYLGLIISYMLFKRQNDIGSYHQEFISLTNRSWRDSNSYLMVGMATVSSLGLENEVDTTYRNLSRFFCLFISNCTS